MSRWSRNAEGRVLYFKDVQCEQCHKTFEAQRSDAKFCSANCRQASKRKYLAINKMADDAISLIEQLESLAGQDIDKRSKWTAQKQLMRIKEALKV